MTMWSPGDIAVAKVDKIHKCGRPGCRGEIKKGTLYRVDEVLPAEDGNPTCLDIGTAATVLDDDYNWIVAHVAWEHTYFEKLVAGDQDIFKLADAPKVLEPA